MVRQHGTTDTASDRKESPKGKGLNTVKICVDEDKQVLISNTGGRSSRESLGQGSRFGFWLPWGSCSG